MSRQGQKFEYGVTDENNGVGNDAFGNGEVVYRPARTSALTGNRTSPIVQPEPIFWLPHSYPMKNGGGSRDGEVSEEETMRPHTDQARVNANLRPFSALIGQPPGEVGKGSTGAAFPVENKLPTTRSPMDSIRMAITEDDLISPTGRIYSGLVGIAAIGVGASIMAILAFQLLISLTYYESPGLSGVQLPDGSTPQILRDLSTILCSISLTLSLCAILSSFLHFYLCLRIISHSDTITGWKERITVYQKRSMYSRTLSTGGFFVSIIIYMISLITYQQLLGATYGSVAVSTIVTVVIAAGALFCTFVLVSGMFFAGFCQELRTNILMKKRQENGGRGTLV